MSGAASYSATCSAALSFSMSLKNSQGVLGKSWAGQGGEGSAVWLLSHARPAVTLNLGQAPACSVVSEMQLYSPGISPSLLPQTSSRKQHRSLL